ncbi:HRDC domain-containing protein [Demequina sp. SYSU T00039]|uniref:HRDC domain-containing protein n=1 Tax=Demequina lignilytica TaxID=3051663 RepID=A0AAW7M2X6_9MICO|nr:MULTISPECIES: HRDC domain-containing protein [unclassified Demequina]MDN4486773.1 HRDC domain-containing protein [Demequina sp. SYSU T00039]MDN4489457.1 HRDC domain-containing protein [Demequina sp. SYSU T00068]
MTESAASSVDQATDPIPLTEPEGGVPDIVDTPEAFAEVCAAFASGAGAVAADAERASGFRYGQATYLAQFKRAGAGIALIDTAAITDLSPLGEAIGSATWVFHAASQDLPGMRELGLEPARVFDTELAARLLGWPRVGLAAVVERELGFALAKEHSAQDWSTRPLPHDWLVYAALDVEVLLDLHTRLATHLAAADKLVWAQQEFEAVRLAPPPAPREDPWRRTSGSHQVRDARSLAIVRSLWEARDAEARRRDTSPGRVLRDQAIVAAAQAKPGSLDDLLKVREFQSKGTRRRAAQWYTAVEAAMALPEDQLPARRAPQGDGPPQQRVWKDKRPEAFARLGASRARIAALVDRLDIPAENLLQPDALRRACWEYRGGGEPWIREFLAGRGARPWQIDLTAPELAEAFENPTAGTDAAGD